MTTLSEATDIPRRRLAQLLQAIGILFNVEKAERIIRAKETAVPLSEVPDHLGASQAQGNVLRKLGIIKPLFAPNRRFRMRKMVSVRDELDALLRELASFDIVPPKMPTDMPSLIRACGEAPVLIGSPSQRFINRKN